ncbi:MAG: cation:proton antiporter [Campylobacterales bacterium]|nr:cation:proton antiporter [Campylobacterales bacterium]
MENFILILTIAIIIMFSPMVSKITNIPVVVVEISFGMLAGFFGFLYADPTLKIIAKFGFLYLMFLAGLEINLKLVKTIKKNLSFNVTLYFVMLYFIAFLICMIFKLNFVYLVALPIFSLGMLMMLIKEYGKNELWLNLALSIGVVGEIVSILALTILSGWLEFGFGLGFYKSILTIFIVLFIGILMLKLFQIIFWWFPEAKKYIIPDIDRLDQDIRFSISLFFILVAVMMYIKIDLVLGAFLAGLFLKLYFHQKEELIEKLSSFGFGFFAPIFFIYTGSTVKIDVLDLEILKHAMLIILAIISIRLISSFVAFYKYLKTKQTILFALSDSMPLTFIVAIAMLAYNNNIISEKEYFSFIIASMIDGLFLMIFIRRLYGWFGMNKTEKGKA